MQVKNQTLSIRQLYEYILDRCFENNERLIIEAFLIKHNLTTNIEEIIEQIELLIKKASTDKSINIEAIKTIAYKILKQFNTSIKSIHEEDEKKIIKSHLSKLARCILVEVQQKAPGYAEKIKEAIRNGMRQAVLVEQYDMEDFENYLRLDYLDISQSKVSVVSIQENGEYLNWNEKKANLKNLIHLLKNDYDCLKSQNDFAALFNSPDNTTKIKWNRNKTDFLILLFSLLYERKYIEIKRGKGLWKVVKCRFVDFDKNSFDFDFTKRLHKLNAGSPTKANMEKDLEAIEKEIKIR
jgi:hypothetical protein